MSVPDVNVLAHQLIAENKALEAIIKTHRNTDLGINKAYDLLCFIIVYPHIISKIRKDVDDKMNIQQNNINEICIQICENNDEDFGEKIYEILDGNTDEYEKILLIITIAQIVVFNPITKDKLVPIMQKYDVFDLILKIYICLE